MRTEMDHNFQFGHERFHGHGVAVRADHLHGHRRLGLQLFHADSLAFDHSTERSGPQLLSCN